MHRVLLPGFLRLQRILTWYLWYNGPASDREAVGLSGYVKAKRKRVQIVRRECVQGVGLFQRPRPWEPMAGLSHRPLSTRSGTS